MKLKCKERYDRSPFNIGQFYEVFEKISTGSGTEYWMFRIPGTTKVVESLQLSEVYEYFETIEETRDNRLNEILKP